jgi:geranylgeranyl pyrophosphate synthase
VKSAIQEKLAAYQARIESAIDQYLPPVGTRPEALHNAMRYSLQAGGKRIRPVLLIASSELFEHIADPMAAAVAIECLHTYTLIHDDLPAVDNSDLRRGRPACHKQFDEATALLAGDALLTFAFQLLSRAYAEQPELACGLIRDLADAAGSEQLIGGQMEDIENEGKTVDAEALRYIHTNKTAALLAAALSMGLRFCNPGVTQLQHLQGAGFHLGMAFQIVDDILDATSNATALGKPVGNDAAAHKSTYVALHGIEGARTEAKTHTDAAIAALEALGGNNHFLLELVRDMQSRTY